ncbi:MAG TPA: YdeI/OmpD-associated family protein [Mycobacteriales bacterium]|nr:YdeI/OmpD-associated family protein [Mycobacteriales bacterium]
MRFTATVEPGGKTATGIEVPASVVSELGGGRRPAVVVTLRSHSYRTTVASMGGRFLIPVSAEVRAAAGVAAGDVLEVGIEPDTEPRTVSVPPDLAAALSAAGASDAWSRLAYTHQKEWVRSILDARKPETRARRVAAAVDGVIHKG